VGNVPLLDVQEIEPAIIFACLVFSAAHSGSPACLNCSDSFVNAVIALIFPITELGSLSIILAFILSYSSLLAAAAAALIRASLSTYAL